jgi:murein DD-endopeptidase MepM/ murein hydrolase activator NlpD
VAGRGGASPSPPPAPSPAARRRGILIAAPRGTPVRAACSGRVAFAGSVGRAGPTVSVRCGALRATYQGLAEMTVSEGRAIVAGERLGLVGGAGRLRLGARLGPGRYVDPAALLGGHAPRLGPAPPAPRRRPPERPAPPPRRPRPLPAPAPAPRTAPLLAWLGLAVLAAALPSGALVWRSRRRRADAHARGTRTAPAAR